jgi:hypothetical protein
MNESSSPRQRGRAAAANYKPDRVRLLLVAEAPPNSEERYFYFEDVREQDSLFRYVCKVLFGTTPDGASKSYLLGKLKDEEVFLIDLMEDPVGPRKHSEFVSELIARCREIGPEKVILIKASDSMLRLCLFNKQDCPSLK